MTTYDKFVPTRTEETHTCGYPLVKISTPQTYDMTSLTDVPAELKGISWDRLPLGYHRFVGTGKYFLNWYDGTQQVEKCPQCQEDLPWRGFTY